MDSRTVRTQRVEASYEEIATVAALPTNDMICHFPFDPRFFGVGLLAMTTLSLMFDSTLVIKWGLWSDSILVQSLVNVILIGTLANIWEGF